MRAAVCHTALDAGAGSLPSLAYLPDRGYLATAALVGVRTAPASTTRGRDDLCTDDGARRAASPLGTHGCDMPHLSGYDRRRAPMPAVTAFLVFLDDTGQQRTLPLDPTADRVRLGRSEAAEVR